MDRVSNTVEQHQPDASSALLADAQDYSSFSPREQGASAAGNSPSTIESNTPAADATIPGSADSNLPANTDQSEWTVMIDLAATKDVNGQALGSAEKAERLRQLVEESQGKPVDIFVQLVDEQEDGSKVLERYEIENGQLTQLESKPAEDFARDLQDFITTATANSDSEKLALIINNDGGGTKGMTGDDNAEGQGTSPAEFVDAVKKGLEGSGHEQLDLLDLDACLMAEAGFLESASQVTNNFVASAETERVRPGGVNAQNLNAIVERLFDNPEMTGQEFGDAIVNEAANGSNQADPIRSVPSAPPTPLMSGSAEHTRFDSGTNTLAHFNLEDYEAFDSAYNEFGNQLAEAVAEPGNKVEIDKLIEGSPRFGMERSLESTDGHNNRDLKTFAEGVQESIEQGRLTDEDGALARSAESLLSAQDEITSSYYGQDTDEGYDEMGGLSAFLPDSQYRDARLTAQTMTGIGQFHDAVEHFLDRLQRHPEGVDDKTIGGIITSLRMESKPITRDDNASNQEVFAPLQQALSNLESVTNVEQLTGAVSNIATLSADLMNSELNARLAAEILPSVQERHDALFGYEAAAGDVGWNRFVDALRS